VSARYAILPEADQDLDDEADYLAREGGLQVGLGFFAAAKDTFDLLAGQPTMGWKCRLAHPDLALVRVFPVTGFERFLIFYRPTRKGIEILRVLHCARDLDAVFAKEGAAD
jgi:toxin ParE1/3/4